MIIGFFHIARVGVSWFASCTSTWETIKRSGLYDATDKIYVNVVGTDNPELPPFYEHEKFQAILSDPKVIVTEAISANVFEFFTMITLQDVAKELSENAKFWYVHSKGATTAVFIPPWDPKDKNPAAYWKEYMEYFVVERWQDCMTLLDSHDIVGTEWREVPYKHFSGNFWWANSEYIKRLPDAREYMEQYRWDRFMPEMYVGRASPKHYCFHNFFADLYRFPALPELYRRP